MTVYMTADIDGYRKACNMGRISLHVNRQRGHTATQSARSDSKAIDTLQHFFFQICYIWNIRMLI